jgi:Fe-S-cluster-containing hydrogenase component 2
MICGAGNEQPDQVYKLAYIYTIAGAKGIDVSADPDIVKVAAKAINDAYNYAAKNNITLGIKPFIIVSVGMKGDPHVRKAFITEKCVKCEKCISVCPMGAICPDLIIDQKKCIGCGRCGAICNFGAITYKYNNKLVRDLLIECKNSGAEQVELHAAIPEDKTIMEEWRLINEIFYDNFVCMCLDRFHLSNFMLAKRIEDAFNISGERLIIQADGVPISGGIDSFNSTLQAVAIGDIINKTLKIKPMILLSGGTNSKTGELARLCNVEFNGVSIGSFARKLIKNGLNKFENEEIRKHAINKAKELIHKNLGDLNDKSEN